jgi:hypothetical protein
MAYYHTITRNDITIHISDYGDTGHYVPSCPQKDLYCYVEFVRGDRSQATKFYSPFTGRIETTEQAERVVDRLLEEYEHGKNRTGQPGYVRIYELLKPVIE